MPKPVILTVDDDRAVLNAVERDLRQKYGRDYRIIKAESGESALDAVKQLQVRNETMALFVVDQRMPNMNGVQFLEQAIQIYPDARKVLLTAYADTEAAINAINKVGLDYYLMKPWDPPEENLYPVLDGLLEDWKANVRLPFEGIRVAGALWSPASHDVKDFLARNSIPYQWLDVEKDEHARKLVEARSDGQAKIPTLFFPDGTVLVEPTLQAVAEQCKLRVRAEKPFYDVIIIGGGPAGLSSAVYASADGLKALLIERQAPGGQAGNSPKIENYLGFPAGISGGDLTRRAVSQATRFGAEILTTRSVTGLRAEGLTRIVTLDDGSEIAAKIVLIATGQWFRTLNLPGVEKWNGAGVYYGAAHTEASYYVDQDAIVIGGANSAAQGMLFLARYARSVTVLVRSEPDWSNYLDNAIRTHPKITLLTRTELKEIHGADKIESVVVENNQTGERMTLPAAAIFVFIGQKPQSDFVKGVLQLTPDGHIMTGLSLIQNGKRPPGWPLDRDPFSLETSMPGVFAAGDVRNGTRHGVAAGVGDGNAAVSLFWQYLSTI
jgi:thioredoxin reductase (NADPH)